MSGDASMKRGMSPDKTERVPTSSGLRYPSVTQLHRVNRRVVIFPRHLHEINQFV